MSQKSPFIRSERQALVRIKRKFHSQRRKHHQNDQVPSRPLLESDLDIALHMFFLASDWAAGCEVLKRHPILLTVEAIEQLTFLAAKLQERQAAEAAAIVRSHLAVLKYAQGNGIQAVLAALRQVG